MEYGGVRVKSETQSQIERCYKYGGVLEQIPTERVVPTCTHAQSGALDTCPEKDRT